MSTVSTIQDLNRDLADQINQEARRDPASTYANKLVGIANGKVVVVTDDWNELARKLRQIEPNPRNTFILEASRDYDEVTNIWGII